MASRVSLGEAAGLANEAANLGIMGPEKLRQTCADHGLPSEGLRTELISRLLIHRLTSVPPTRGEFSPLSPSFAPFSSPNRSELRKACVQRGLSDVGSSHELLRRLQESRKSSTEDSPAAMVRNTLAAVRKATGGEGATPTTEMPTKKRLRSKSPASCLYGRPPSDVAATPPKRLRSKSPAAMAGSPRQNLTEGLSDVCGAAVQSLLMLRPQQLEAECKRQGLSPRKSPHAMAYRLATARLRDLASSASAAPTELLSPVSSILKRGKFGTSRGRSPTPPRSRRVSFAGHMSDELPRTPRSVPNRRSTTPASRAPRRSPTPKARAARSQTPRRQTPQRRSPSMRGTKSPATSLLCGVPGAKVPPATPPSTPQRRSKPRSNVPTGDKVRRVSQSSNRSPSEKKTRTPTPTPRRSRSASAKPSPPSRSRSVTAKHSGKCHGIKRDGKPCSFNGNCKPSGAVFFYCGKHKDTWRARERR